MGVALDRVWFALSAVQIGTDTSYHASLACGWFAANRFCFDILIEHFIGIQLRTIGRQMEQLNLVGISCSE